MVQSLLSPTAYNPTLKMVGVALHVSSGLSDWFLPLSWEVKWRRRAGGGGGGGGESPHDTLGGGHRSLSRL